MSFTWAALDSYRRDRDSGALTALLLATDEATRREIGAELLAQVRAETTWWDGRHHLAGAYGLVTIACAPSAARAAAVLAHREMDCWHEISIGHFLEIARARDLSWLGDLGLRLGGRMPTVFQGGDDWRFVAALLEEGKAEPPVTEGFVRGWLDAGLPRPYLDRLLPVVFEIETLGDRLEPLGFPGIVAALVAEGRLDRSWVLAATVGRLLTGTRPQWMRPFAQLHEALSPTPEELAGFTDSYLRLLPSAPGPVATLAQRALRSVDDIGRLPLESLLEAGAATLVRSEKGLVRAQLSWLDRVARRTPERAAEIVATVAVALEHPSLDVREQARTVASRHRPGAFLGSLDAAETPEPPPVETAAEPAEPPPAPPPAGMPPPIETAAELAEEIVALLHQPTAVRWERVMAALTELPTEGLAGTLGPVLDQRRGQFSDRWGRMPFLGEVIGARIGRERGHVMRERLREITHRSWTDAGGGMDRSLIEAPSGILTLRIAELAVQVTGSPVPQLLATPTHVTGSLDALVLVERLERLEAAGGEPWPLDFQQALLRVPRRTGPDVLARADRLTSPSGRRLAGWLRSGGLPDPVTSRLEQCSRDHTGQVVARRVVADMEPARGDDGRILLEDAVSTIRRAPRPGYHVYTTPQPDVLAMVLPHHRDAVAAWALPELAALADQDARGAALLPLLADASGPIGAAMTLALAYGLGARHTSDRVAAVDALLTLAAGPEPFATALGADLGDLCADGTVKLGRVVAALTDAYRAGASTVIWEIVAAALPALLPAAPRGLPDLIELGTLAGGRGEIPGLSEVAGRPGNSRLVREARRLHARVAACR